jgi:hypothetical protein
MRRERTRGLPRQDAASEPVTRTGWAASSQLTAGTVRLIVIVSIAGSVVLFLLCRDLTARFEGGSPVTHSVNPYLAIWISLVAVAATLTVWIIAMLEHRSPNDLTKALPRRPRRRGGSKPASEGRVR